MDKDFEFPPAWHGDQLNQLLLRHRIPDNISDKDLNEARYTLSECGYLEDSGSDISVEQIIQCWQLVEWLRVQPNGFPEKLRM